jgi:DNA-binding MarR family transcriptional regulator
MLRHLLQLVMEKETVNDSELACELSISQALIKQMLGELVRRGYLQPLTQDYPTHCKRCLLHAVHLSGNRPRIFTLTAKGDRIAANIELLTESIRYRHYQ